MPADMGPVLQSIVNAAMSATGAADGWVVAAHDGGLSLVAGSPGVAAHVGRSLTADGSSASFVISSAQPVVLSPRGEDPVAAAARALTGRQPSGVLSVPCTAAGNVVGALEVVDKAGGDRFSFDDLELLSILSGIAGSALGQGDGSAGEHPTADSLSASLHALATGDPARFAALATTIAVLVEHG